MDTTGPIAKGLVLSQELMRLSQRFSKLTKRTRYSGSEVVALSNELDIFAHLYNDFFSTSVVESRPTKRLVSWTEETVDALRKLLRQAISLAFISGDSLIGNLAARVKSSLHNNEVKCLRLSLRVVTEGINVLTNIRNIEKIDEQVELLRSAIVRDDRQAREEQFSMTLETIIQTLKCNRNDCRKRRHVIEHRLKDAKIELFQQYDKKSRASDIVPHPERLISFTKSVDRHVENVLYHHKAGERRRSSNINTSTKQFLSPDRSSQSSQTTRSASRVSSSSSSRALRSPYSPVVIDSRSNFTTFPDLTELLGLNELTINQARTGEEGKLKVINVGRRPQYSSASPTQSVHANITGPEVLLTSEAAQGTEVPTTSSAAPREVLVEYQSYAYDDVSSEDEAEGMRWREDALDRQERSVSPEGF